MSVGAPKQDVIVTEVVAVNDLIKRFRFVRADGAAMPAFSGGAHVVIEMYDHGTRRLNPYSLMSDPEDRSGYEISVRRDDVGCNHRDARSAQHRVHPARRDQRRAPRLADAVVRARLAIGHVRNAGQSGLRASRR